MEIFVENQYQISTTFGFTEYWGKTLFYLFKYLYLGNTKIVKEAETQLKSRPSNVIEEKINNPTYPIIQFLGTGSTISNLYRNVSCILIQEYYFH